MNILSHSNLANDSGRVPSLFPDACSRGAIPTTRAKSEGIQSQGLAEITRLPTFPEPSGMIIFMRAVDRPQARCWTPQEPALPPSAEPKRSILLVEDVADAADCQARVLTLSGFDVHVAAAPPDALALAASNLFDAALIDIGLKHEIDGIDLGSMLRELHGNANLPLLALTGWPNQMSRAAEADFDGYLLKPVQPCHLLDAVDDAIRRRALVECRHSARA